MNLPTKTCSKCGAVLPATTEFFAADKYKKSGITPACLTCRRLETRKWQLANPGHNNERAKEWYKKNATPTYISWQAMKKRCLDPNNDHYKSYGAKGVSVCNRWLESFKNFLSDMGERPENTTLGRFGDIGNYEPSNCKWMTLAEQQSTRVYRK